MFERFTEKPIKAIMLAQEEARRLGHNFVGTEQILLGLIEEGTGVAAKVLKSMGVSLKDARIEVEKIIGLGSGDVEAEIPFTPRAKTVLEFSSEEAQQLGHNYIGTEHLLLGLIREGEGVAVRVLENLGVDLSKVPTLINEMLLETDEVEVDVSRNDSNTPQNNYTNTPTPQNDETNTPQNDETNTPQNDDINTPQNNDTNTPQNNDTNTPQNNDTNTPQNNDTNTPQNDDINTPQNDETNTPQNNDTNESKLKEAKDSYTPQQIAGSCLILLLFGVLLCIFIYFVYGWFKTPKTIDLTTFLQLVKAEKVVEIEVKDNLVTTKKKDGKKVKTYIESNMGIYQQLKSAGIEVDTSKVSIQIKPSANLQSFIFNAIPWVFLVILAIYTYQLANKKSNNKSTYDLRKNTAKKSNENQPQFSFDNIGGAAQAKEELKTVIEFIQNPEYFQSLGARMPKGIILEGLPGTGKTLLAKAVASASNANFFYMSASEFVELYVGVGASRVRDLFNEAKKNLPAIIYIDELDAVGQRRNLSLSGSNQEQSNTLNQLLTELDGFESNQRIFVIASTNRAEILDAALLRPGRFDQRIVVDLPSFAERCQILEIHLQNKKVAEDVNIEDIARYTVDFSGAELANIVNKAAILAAKNKRDSIDKDLLEETTKAQGAIVPSAVNVQQLKQDISKEIVGQDVALTAIAWSVCSHYANIFSRSESGVSYGNKPNLFLYGPPGSGKTAIIKATAKTLEVPFVEMTASGLVKEQAYMQKTLNRLLREANDDIRRAECGMVCLYGMEEITFDDLKFVQEELARVIEGDKFDAVEEGFAKNNRLIDTQNILFICELTLDGKSRSKNSVSRPKYDGTGQNATDDEILGDLGLVRRLINQFPMIVSTEVLKQEELLDILTHGDNSPVSLFERRYQDLGIQVELEQSALDVVTKECFQQGGDARLLKRLLNEILREYLGDSVSEKTVTVNGLMAEKALAPRIALKKNLNSNDGQENMVTTFEEVEKSSSETEIDEQNYLKFLAEVLEATKESNGDSKVVYPLLQQNLDLLDNNFVDILRNWATANFVEADVAEYMAMSIGKFSDLIQQFPLGNKANNMEISIAAYEQVLLVYTQTDFPMEWAGTQNNLGVAYSDRIRGDKAQNIEAAIAAYQQALLVRTQTDFPMEWAGTQNNLGGAYSKRIRGDKAENIEAAIAAYQQAFLVCTQTDFPMDWAATQNNLGVAYSDRIRGNKAQNIEAAIAAYEQALLVYTQTDFPMDWATTQICLGAAYSKRIRGDKAQNIEAAIAAYEQALLVRTQTDFPMDWAATQNNLGNAYMYRIRGDKAENIEAAIAAFQQALQVRTQTDFPMKWAMTQNNLGAAYIYRIRGDKAENIEAAIAAFQQALQVFTQTDFPIDWADTQNKLGAAYSNRIRGDKAENIEAAIAAFQQALQVYTQTDFPMKWAMTQNNLGIAYRNRIRGDKAQNIESAIAACQQALLVFTQTDFPMEWAGTQNNLGDVYSDRIRGDKAENIEAAIAAHEQALLVRTQTDLPMDWAETQNNLGVAYSERIRGDKAQNIESAIAACQQALLVHTQTDFPFEWARTQNNLGGAYSNRIRGDKAENIEAAIAAFQQALQVFTQTDFPMEWAGTQNNLGDVYSDRIRGDKAENIEAAIAAYEQALLVRTQTDLPMDWAETQNNLGAAYGQRIRGDKAQNIESAIAACQQALLVYTLEADPITYLTITSNLGNLYFANQNWQLAADNYEKAIAAVELSRSWATTDKRRQEIIAEAIDVYQNLVQTYINLEQWDKAFKTAERSKTRSLVELLAKRDIYPKGDVPQEIIAELDRLRSTIPSLERRLQGVLERLSGNTSPPEEPQRRSLMASQEQLQQELQLSRQQLDETLERIKPIDSSFSLTQRVEPISWSDTQSRIDESTTIIEWYITKDKIITFILTANSLLVKQTDKKKLEALENWRDNYLNLYAQKGKKQWKDDLASNLKRLAKILNINGLLTQVGEIFDQQGKKCDRLILIPHRFLHLFPLHAMPLANGDLLMERFPGSLSYAPSLQLLQLSQTWNRSSLKHFFSVKNPTEDLGFTEPEVATIRADFYPNDDVLERQQATKTALTQERLAETNVAHFACHGYFNFKSPIDSALLLAGSITPTPQETADGNGINLEKCLTLGDIFALDLRQCRLTSLSACETGLSDFKSLGDEYIGLPSGFLYAGSPSVVSSLWTVNNLSTAFLMIQLYKKLLNSQEQTNVAIALNQAQLWLRDLTKEELEKWILENKISLSSTLEMNLSRSLHQMSDKDQPFESPFYWAGFCAIG